MACGLSTATPQSATPTATAQSAFAATLQVSIASATPTPQSPQMTATAVVAAVETLAAAANTTPTPGVTVGGSNGNNGGTSSGNGGTGDGNGGTSGSKGGPSPDPSSSPTPTLPPIPLAEPYLVKQIETLGGEAISGIVCSVTRPFNVLSKTPRVAFTFIFVPQDAQHGKVSYTYSIPKAGESHNAAGTYSLSPVGKDGTLQLSLSVSDHVVFKGFDGNIPLRSSPSS